MNPQGLKRSRDYQERSDLTFHTDSSAWGYRGSQCEPQADAWGWMPANHQVAALELLQPDIAHEDLAGAFDFETDETAFTEFGGIVVDEHRHHVTVDDVRHR